MDNEKLDKCLRKYAPSEIRHKEGIKSVYESNPSVINTKGEKIYNFVINLSSDILFSRNARFDSVPMHTHDHIEINYMYSGSCTQTIDGNTNILKQGQMTFIDTRTPHSIGYTDEDDIMINFIIKKEYLNSKFFSNINSNNLITSFFINAINDKNTNLNYMIFNTENNKRIQMFIKEFAWENYFPSSNSKEIKNSLFILIILEMINTLDTSINYESITESNTIILSALQYIESDFMTCTLESTAKHLSVNPCYLTTLLKKQLHQSYKELIIQLKMDYACKLLLNSSETIDSIARQVGYQNLSFFYRKFKQLYYCTPKEYREQQKELF